jgi:hypothetical protein
MCSEANARTSLDRMKSEENYVRPFLNQAIRMEIRKLDVWERRVIPLPTEQRRRKRQRSEKLEALLLRSIRQARSGELKETRRQLARRKSEKVCRHPRSHEASSQPPRYSGIQSTVPRSAHMFHQMPKLKAALRKQSGLRREKRSRGAMRAG